MEETSWLPQLFEALEKRKSNWRISDFNFICPPNSTLAALSTQARITVAPFWVAWRPVRVVGGHHHGAHVGHGSNLHHLQERTGVDDVGLDDVGRAGFQHFAKAVASEITLAAASRSRWQVGLCVSWPFEGNLAEGGIWSKSIRGTTSIAGAAENGTAQTEEAKAAAAEMVCLPGMKCEREGDRGQTPAWRKAQRVFYA